MPAALTNAAFEPHAKAFIDASSQLLLRTTPFHGHLLRQSVQSPVSAWVPAAPNPASTPPTPPLSGGTGSNALCFGLQLRACLPV